MSSGLFNGNGGGLMLLGLIGGIAAGMAMNNNKGCHGHHGGRHNKSPFDSCRNKYDNSDPFGNSSNVDWNSYAVQKWFKNAMNI